jgi:hypothetical protein
MMNISARLPSNIRTDLLFVLTLFVIGMFGSMIILYSTTWGPWAKADSAEYIEAAENLIQGRGIALLNPSGEFQSLTIRPPLYSIILAGLGQFGADILVVARWLNVVLFASLFFIMGLTLRSIVEDPGISLLVPIMVLSYPIFILNFTGVMAEPIFFFLGYSGIVLLVRYIREAGLQYLVFSAILTGLSLLARFSGIAFLGATLCGLSLLGRVERHRRVRDIILYAFLGLLPFSIWAFSLYRVGRTPGEYEFYTSVSWDMLEPLRGALIDIIYEWIHLDFLLPSPPYLTKVALLLLIFSTFTLLFVGLVVNYVKKRESESSSFFHELWGIFCSLYLLFVFIYLAFLIVTHIVVRNPKPAINERLLSPILFGMILSYLAFVGPLTRVLNRRVATRFSIIGIGVLLIFANATQSISLVKQLHLEGLGYTGREWQSSEIIEAVRSLPDVPLISNDIEAIKFFTGRPAHNISELIQNQPVDEFDSYGEDERDPIQMIFRREGAALILFENKFWKFQDLYGWEAKNRVEKLTKGLQQYFQGQDGAIYFYPSH